MFGEEGIMRTNTERRGYRACLQRGGTFLDRKGIRGEGVNCTERKGDRYGHVPYTLCIERKVERERKMGGGSNGLA